MPRVRKESEKYNASDTESYSGQTYYGSRDNRSRENQSRGNVRGRARGHPRSNRGQTNYDPDYDRNVTYRPRLGEKHKNIASNCRQQF